MKSNLIFFIIVILLLFSFLVLAAFGNFVGYMITASCAIALISLVICLLFAAGDIRRALSKNINKYSLIVLGLILIFFLLFSVLALPKTELIFFDENIYQGVALNILHNGNAMMCAYGTQYVQKCFANELGFDPAGWPFLIMVAFKFFGISNATTHNLELFLGALSIVLVFFIANTLTNRKELAPISAAIFALIPELFIWSKTLANPDLPFMAFAALSLLLFLIFIKTRKRIILLASTFSLIFTIYLRVEALLLVPFFLVLFITLSDSEIKEAAIRRIKELLNELFSHRDLLFLLLVFFILIDVRTSGKCGILSLSKYSNLFGLLYFSDPHHKHFLFSRFNQELPNYLSPKHNSAWHTRCSIFALP
jgi:hypothetical protein